MKSWGDFYAGAGDTGYLLDHLAIHRDFIKEILDRSPEKLLEAGCGSAIMSVFFAMAGIKVMACDRDDEVLDQAAQTAHRWKTRVNFANQDLLNLGFPENSFDIAFSQGVLEHMSDDEIRRSVTQLLRVSPLFIFSVPSAYYKHRDFGNERLMNEKQWAKILSGVGHLQLKPYYSIRTKRNFLLKRPLMLMGIVAR